MGYPQWELLHKLLVSIGKMLAPSRQGRAVLDEVIGVPLDALFIQFTGRVIVGADYVVVAAFHRLNHEVDHLGCRPGPVRFSGTNCAIMLE